MKVIWSKTADINYRKNLDYLKREWDYEVLINFIDEVDNCINRISDNPSIGMFDKLISCNKLLVVKQIYLFYEVSDNVIYIHNIWNNKRKPFWS